MHCFKHQDMLLAAGEVELKHCIDTLWTPMLSLGRPYMLHMGLQAWCLPHRRLRRH